MPRLRVWAAACTLLLGLTADASERLVVAGGTITEIVYALGAEGQLLAVDSTSNWPPAARELPRIGYVRSLPVEGILALGAEHLLVTSEAGPERALRQLERHIRVTRLPTAWTPEGLIERVHAIAALVDRVEAGAALSAALRAHFEAIRGRLPLEHPPRVLFLLATGGAELFVAGANTQAQALLDALQLPNAVNGLEGYKPLGLEAALALRPELIVVAETTPGAFQLRRYPALAETPAGRSGRLLVRDSLFLLGFGPRLPDAMEAVLQAATRGEDR